MLQTHSRDVSTLTWTWAPAEATTGGTPLSDVSHREGVGPLSSDTVLPPHASADAANARPTSARLRHSARAGGMARFTRNERCSCRRGESVGGMPNRAVVQTQGRRPRTSNLERENLDPRTGNAHPEHEPEKEQEPGTAILRPTSCYLSQLHV